jgi:hypothetical protein
MAESSKMELNEDFYTVLRSTQQNSQSRIIENGVGKDLQKKKTQRVKGF